MDDCVGRRKTISENFELMQCQWIDDLVNGATHSYHVGASGLIFALYGYVIGSAIIRRKISYIAFLIIFGTSYFYSLTRGLIPQEGISFAGHFGGLVAGLLVSYSLSYKKK